MIAIPNQPENGNIRSLANWKAERVSGIAGTTLPLTNVIDTEATLVFQNGSLLDPNTYTITANTIELGSSAVSGDVFVVFYHYTRPAGV